MSNAHLNDGCPRCGAKGRNVKAITVKSHVNAATKQSLGLLEGFRFCPTADCANAYYRPEDGVVVDKKNTRFPIFQKETTPERLVCYCFQHSVQEIVAEVSSTGDSKVIQEIKENCKRGMDDCARNNPQGSCCLGNVSKVVRAAKGSGPTTDIQNCCHADTAGNDSESGCNGGECENETVGAHEEEMKTRRGSQFALTGAVLAAVASSACCWLPLLLIGTGISTAGGAGFFESYRFLFVAGSLGLLAVGFYLVYFRKTDCAEGAECAVPDGRMRRFTRSMLWIATVMIAAFTLFPNALSAWVNRREPSAEALTQSADSQQIVFSIEGMTCAACSVHTEQAILAVPGVASVAVDYESKLAQILAEDFVSTVAVEKAVSELGYVATEVKNERPE